MGQGTGAGAFAALTGAGVDRGWTGTGGWTRLVLPPSVKIQMEAGKATPAPSVAAHPPGLTA